MTLSWNTKKSPTVMFLFVISKETNSGRFLNLVGLRVRNAYRRRRVIHFIYCPTINVIDYALRL